MSDQYIELPEVNIKADNDWENKPYAYTDDSADDRIGRSGPSVAQDSGKDWTGIPILNEVKKLSTQYGNNVFSLTIPKADCAIYGVLTEIPEISMSCEWKPNGPTMIQDAMQKLQQDSNYQLLVTVLGAKQIPIVLGGSSTTRMYSQPSRPSFKLSFRVYARQSIGPSPMSGYRKAMAMLAAYASPLHASDADNAFDTALTNFGGIVVEALAILNDAGQKVLSKIHNTKYDYAKEPGFTKNLKTAYKQGTTAANNFASALGKPNAAEAGAAIKKGFEDMAKMIGTVVSGPTNSALHSDDRVNDTLNYHEGMLGGAIWYLTILPGLLSAQIPVYVDSWSAKPSKEIDANGEASYYDFTLSCTMDQIKSGAWWGQAIRADDYVSYKNLQAHFNAK